MTSLSVNVLDGVFALPVFKRSGGTVGVIIVEISSKARSVVKVASTSFLGSVLGNSVKRFKMSSMFILSRSTV